MDTNITFRIDSQTKARMTENCNQLGMPPHGVQYFRQCLCARWRHAVSGQTGYSVACHDTGTNTD